MNTKPLGRKNYGSIPHLPDSRMGPSDHKCHEGQARIATVKTRDKNDEVFVQEKLDGSNVGVARIEGRLYPIGRAGWPAVSSPHEQHRLFHNWVYKNWDRFMSVLADGERICGEWLAQAHGTRYKLHHEPFVVFDIMIENTRFPYDNLTARLRDKFVIPRLLHRGGAFSIENAMKTINVTGFHGALDPVEGAVWRVERDVPTGVRGEKIRVVDFLVKYVRPDKEDGIYLNDKEIWNWRPDQ